jgi:hypothetical protein
VLFHGESGMNVYRQPDAFARAWAVHRLTRIQNQNQMNWYVANRLELLRTEGLMFRPPPPLPSCVDPKDDVRLVEDQGNRVGVKASLNCAAMIVVSDVDYPGWRAYVDGKPAPIYGVNGAMRGVVVPAGVHSLTMRYRPPIVYEGAVLSLLGIIGAIVLARSKRV